MADSKEVYNEQRRIVLQDVKTLHFYDDFNSTGSMIIVYYYCILLLLFIIINAYYY